MPIVDRIKSVLHEGYMSARQLAAPQLRATAVLLLPIWLLTAFNYYGLVQLVTHLQVAGTAQDGGGSSSSCVNGVLHVSSGRCPTCK